MHELAPAPLPTAAAVEKVTADAEAREDVGLDGIGALASVAGASRHHRRLNSHSRRGGVHLRAGIAEAAGAVAAEGAGPASPSSSATATADTTGCRRRAGGGRLAATRSSCLRDNNGARWAGKQRASGRRNPLKRQNSAIARLCKI